MASPSYLPVVTNSMKWWLAGILGVLFFVLSSPGAYSLTNAALDAAGLPGRKTCGPSLLTVVVHSILFALLIRLVMW